MAVSPDGTHFVTGYEGIFQNARVKVWDAETGACLCTLQLRSPQGLAVVVSADGGRAATVGFGFNLEAVSTYLRS